MKSIKRRRDETIKARSHRESEDSSKKKEKGG